MVRGLRPRQGCQVVEATAQNVWVIDRHMHDDPGDAQVGEPRERGLVRVEPEYGHLARREPGVLPQPAPLGQAALELPQVVDDRRPRVTVQGGKPKAARRVAADE